MNAYDTSAMITAPTGTALPVLAEQAWDRFGDQTVTVFEGQRVTAAASGARAARVATGLVGLGVRPGDRVVICMANCLEVGISYHAAWRAGAVVTPVLFLLSAEELHHILIDSAATIVITTPEFLAKVQQAVAGVETVRHVVVAGATEELAATVAFGELETGPPAPVPGTDPGALAALLYTGGTTGRSKGVQISHDALSAAAWSSHASGNYAGLTVSILPLPMAHVFGLMVSTMSLHAFEPGTSVLMRWFDPAGWLGLVETERVQIGSIVPTMLRVLLDQPLEAHDLSSLRRLSSGSAPLPDAVLDAWAARVPGVEIGDGYGCTESTAVISSTPYGQVRRGSVGRAGAIVELQVQDTEGRPVAAGEDGEVCARGPMLMDGYWQAPDETAYTLRGGWLHTGDVGRLDADGYLFLVDRIKDVIIRGGFNVYPRDVEDVLMRHPDVANAAVVGRPSDEVGEEVVAFVQLRPGAVADPEAIRAFARERLSAVKYPRDVRLIDQVPLTSVGKLDRKALRSQL